LSSNVACNLDLKEDCRKEAQKDAKGRRSFMERYGMSRERVVFFFTRHLPL